MSPSEVPCRVAFYEDGRWRIINRTGRYADLQGEGLLHNDGLAIARTSHDVAGGFP